MQARAVLLIGALTGLPVAAVAGGDAARGEQLYASRCFACHSVDAHRVGPKHRGVFGSKAGSAEGYVYSPALETTTVVWNETTLDQWLTNPQALIPGQKMNFRVALQRDRADLIAYLKSVSDAAGSR